MNWFFLKATMTRSLLNSTNKSREFQDKGLTP